MLREADRTGIKGKQTGSQVRLDTGQRGTDHGDAVGGFQSREAEALKHCSASYRDPSDLLEPLVQKSTTEP